MIYRAKGAAANAPKLNRRINNNTSLELAGTQLAVGDVDGDGKVNAADYIRIRRAILGM